MSDKSISHLHVHTEYSMLDGAARCKDVVTSAVEDGQTAIGSTDHGNMYAVPVMYQECEKQGVKYVPGFEAYMAQESRYERPQTRRTVEDDSGGETAEGKKVNYHLTLLAENNTGYKNLIQLSSRSYLEGYYIKPRIDWELLQQYHEGIIATTGCLGGQVLQALMHDDPQGALAIAARLQDIFGKDNLFVEIQDHGIDDQKRTMTALLDLAKKLDAPLLATNDSHYVHKHDAVAHDALLCQPPGTKVLTSLDGQFVNIEDVSVGDSVVSWDGSNRRGEIRATPSKVTETGTRDYEGHLVRAFVDHSTSEYTHDHICVARLDAPTTKGNYCTYLMRKGDSYRVGHTQYRRDRQKARPGGGMLGPICRLKEQLADAVWILDIYETEHQAREEEAWISHKFGIPMWSFSEVKYSPPRTAYYKSLWTRAGDLTSVADVCLTAFGRDIEYPFWDVRNEQPTQRRPVPIRACNLLDGMLMCRPNKGQLKTHGDNSWFPVALEKIPYQGTVHSIEVEEDHTYIADGIVTHNCIQTKAKRSDKDRFKFTGEEHYLKTAIEMRSLFSEHPDSCDNTLWIADRSDVQLDFNTLHLPKFPVPEGYVDDAQYLSDLVLNGAVKRWGNNYNDQVLSRLAFELRSIIDMGFSSYFLIVWDLIEHAKASGIRIGPGRGSAAGCAVAYALGITDLDPIKYDLLFERFLNPSRISMPDIDIDMSPRGRDELIRYTAERYGQDHVAQIITFSRIRGRSAVRDSARVLEKPYVLGDKISKAMPPMIMGHDTPLYACFEKTEGEEAGYSNSQKLRDMYATDPDVKEIIDVALGLEDLRRQDGIHAAAVVIGDSALTDYLPIQQKWKDGKPGPITTQYEMHAVEDLGLLKMDYLGLTNLDTITDCIATLARQGIDVDIDNVPLNDQRTFEMLQAGDTIGVFQLESRNMQELVKRLRPTTFDDIAALVALYRPGPMSANMHNDYADRKNGKQGIMLFHEDAADLLDDTYGLMIYQEQVMKVAQKFAGYSLAEADSLRKAMGKKIREMMAKEKDKFINGCLSQGYPPEVGDSLFRTIEKFADYAFNKCISGDTIVTMGAANQYSDGKVTVKELYDRMNTVGYGSGGDCLWCKKKSAKSKGLCYGCKAWRYKATRGELSVLALDLDGRVRPKPLAGVHSNGVKELFRVTLADGRSIDATSNHRHMTTDGWKRVDELSVGDALLVDLGADTVSGMSLEDMRTTKGERQNQGSVLGAYGDANYGYVDGGFAEFKKNSALLPMACFNDLSHGGRLEVAHLDGDRTNNSTDNLRRLCVSCHKKHDYRENGRRKRFDKGHPTGGAEIVSIESVGYAETYDLEMGDPGHNFVANGIVTHNSHSYGYGFISYQTAYLKANYPAEYMAALCSSASEVERIGFFLSEARAMGLAVNVPSINDSEISFTVVNGEILVGLSAISSIGELLAGRVITERNTNGLFSDIWDFAARMAPQGIDKTCFANMIDAGAFDTFGYPRLGLAGMTDSILKAVRKDNKKQTKGSMQLFDDSDSRIEIPDYEYPWEERLRLEKKLIGIYVSGHPLDDVQEWIDDGANATLEDLEDWPVGKDIIKIAGLVTNVAPMTTRNGDEMARFTLEDKFGAKEVTVFNKLWVKIRQEFHKEDFLAIVKCRVTLDQNDQKDLILVEVIPKPIEEVVPNNGTDFKIYLPQGFQTNEKFIARLRGLTLGHRGPSIVLLHLNRKAYLKLPDEHKVRVTPELIEGVKKLFTEYRESFKPKV